MVSAGASTIPAADDFLEHLHVGTLGPVDAPALVLLHGWGSSAEVMHHAAADLADEFRIINIDLPGHGRTPPPPEPWGVPEYAAVVAACLETHDVDGATIIGHSNGGRIALYMASDDRYCRLIARLVLVAPSGMRPDRPPSYYVKTAWIGLLKAPFRLLPEGPRRRGLAWLRTTIYWKLAASSDYQQVAGVMRETFVRTVTHHLDDRVAHIDVPTLIIRGSDDEAVSDAQVRRLQQAVSGAELVTIPGAGHYPFLDSPQDYLRVMRPFVTQRTQDRHLIPES